MVDIAMIREALKDDAIARFPDFTKAVSDLCDAFQAAPPPATDLKAAFPGADGIGASFNRDLDAWVLYSTPTCERFGHIDGYDPKRIDAVLKTLRGAFTPASNNGGQP